MKQKKKQNQSKVKSLNEKNKAYQQLNKIYLNYTVPCLYTVTTFYRDRSFAGFNFCSQLTAGFSVIYWNQTIQLIITRDKFDWNRTTTGSDAYRRPYHLHADWIFLRRHTVPYWCTNGIECHFSTCTIVQLVAVSRKWNSLP